MFAVAENQDSKSEHLNLQLRETPLENQCWVRILFSIGLRKARARLEVEPIFCVSVSGFRIWFWGNAVAKTTETKRDLRKVCQL